MTTTDTRPCGTCGGTGKRNGRFADAAGLRGNFTRLCIKCNGTGHSGESIAEIQQGYFTPIAQVLCGPCNNELVGTPDNGWAKTQPVVKVDLAVVEASAHLGVCDRCQCEVSIDREDVAVCQDLVVALKTAGFVNACLQQTGGLCVAVGLGLEDDKDFFFAVLGEEGDTPGITIGFYRDYDQFEDGRQVAGLENATVEACVLFVHEHTGTLTCELCGDEGAASIVCSDSQERALCEGCASQQGERPFGVDPDHKAIEFLNEHIKVIKVTVPPASLCGRGVPWGDEEKAQGYGYRCVLDDGHAGECDKEPRERDLIDRQIRWDLNQSSGGILGITGPRPTR